MRTSICGSPSAVMLQSVAIRQCWFGVRMCMRAFVATLRVFNPHLLYVYVCSITFIKPGVYEMATLRQAFKAKDINSLAYKVIRGKVARIPGAYSDDLSNLVMAMLALEPEERPVKCSPTHSYEHRTVTLPLSSTWLSCTATHPLSPTWLSCARCLLYVHAVTN